jgi:hypothetical protein
MRGPFGAVLIFALCLAWMALDGRDPFERMRDDWSRQEADYHEALKSATTAAAKRKVVAKKLPMPLTFAERCVALARSKPDTPAGLSALCWAAHHVPLSAPGTAALQILKRSSLDHTDPRELLRALESVRATSAARPDLLAPLVLDVAERDLDHPLAARLLTWVCARQLGDRSEEEPPSFAEAADLIADRFAASPEISIFCETLGHGTGSPPWAGKYEKHLRKILNQNGQHLVRCTASFALASVVQGCGEDRQSEAEALYRQFAKDFGGSDPAIRSLEGNLVVCAKAEAELIRKRSIDIPGLGARDREAGRLRDASIQSLE